MQEFKKISSMLVLLALAMTTACSDKDKGPPDDEDFRFATKANASVNGSCDGSFYDCAMSVLEASGLTSSEKESLSGCDFELAKPTSSDADVFEVSKQAVKRSCE